MAKLTDREKKQKELAARQAYEKSRKAGNTSEDLDSPEARTSPDSDVGGEKETDSPAEAQREYGTKPQKGNDTRGAPRGQLASRISKTLSQRPNKLASLNQKNALFSGAGGGSSDPRGLLESQNAVSSLLPPESDIQQPDWTAQLPNQLHHVGVAPQTIAGAGLVAGSTVFPPLAGLGPVATGAMAGGMGGLGMSIMDPEKTSAQNSLLGTALGTGIGAALPIVGPFVGSKLAPYVSKFTNNGKVGNALSDAASELLPPEVSAASGEATQPITPPMSTSAIPDEAALADTAMSKTVARPLVPDRISITPPQQNLAADTDIVRASQLHPASRGLMPPDGPSEAATSFARKPLPRMGDRPLLPPEASKGFGGFKEDLFNLPSGVEQGVQAPRPKNGWVSRTPDEMSPHLQNPSFDPFGADRGVLDNYVEQRWRQEPAGYYNLGTDKERLAALTGQPTNLERPPPMLPPQSSGQPLSNLWKAAGIGALGAGFGAGSAGTGVMLGNELAQQIRPDLRNLTGMLPPEVDPGFKRYDKSHAITTTGERIPAAPFKQTRYKR